MLHTLLASYRNFFRCFMRTGEAAFAGGAWEEFIAADFSGFAAIALEIPVTMSLCLSWDAQHVILPLVAGYECYVEEARTWYVGEQGLKDNALGCLRARSFGAEGQMTFHNIDTPPSARRPTGAAFQSPNAAGPNGAEEPRCLTPVAHRAVHSITTILLQQPLRAMGSGGKARYAETRSIYCLLDFRPRVSEYRAISPSLSDPSFFQGRRWFPCPLRRVYHVLAH